jgi:DNA-binding NtrC family response regulator/tetratricopeptide (TPR) repeat protein
MDQDQLSPRFRVSRWVHRPDDGIALANVRDAVTGDPSAAVWIATRRDRGLTVALHHRWRMLERLALVPPMPELRIVETDEGIVVLFPQFEGMPWVEYLGTAGTEEGARARDALRGALGQWAVEPFVLGRVRADALWWNGEAARLLPTAWLLPVEPEPGSTHADLHDVVRAHRELDELARALGVEPPPSIAPPSAIPEPLRDVLRSTRAAGAWLAVHADDPSEVTSAVRAWAAQEGLVCARLGPFGLLRSTRREIVAPTVVLLDDVGAFPPVVDPLAELQRTGWIDGHETLVVVEREPLRDEILGLYAAKRFGANARRDFRWKSRTRDRTSTQLDAATQTVLDFVIASERGLTSHLLARATELEPALLARAIDTLLLAGDVCVTYAQHAEARHLQLVVRAKPEVSAQRSARDRARSDELRTLLATSNETRPHPALPAQWLRAESAQTRGAPDALRRWRELAKRAQTKGQDLLAFAAWGRVLELHERDSEEAREDRVRAAICRGEQYQLGGEIDRAVEVLLEALEADRGDDPDLALEAELVLSLAQLEIHRSDYAAAEQRLSALLARAKDRLPVEPRGRVYVELGWVQLFLGRTRESVRSHELALRILDPLRHADLIARVHNSIGFALYKESDYTGSIVHYERAVRLREQLGDELGVARAYNNLALSQRALGQLEEAERSLVESLRRKRAAGDELSYAASLLNLGFVQLDRGDPVAAEQSASRCLEIAVARRHPETEAEAWGLRGEATLALGRADTALEYLQRDLAICEATEHQSERLATLRRLASVLVRLDRDEEAAAHLVNARELLLHQPSRFETALIDGIDAHLNERAGRAEIAVELYGAAARGLGAVGRSQAQVEMLARRGLVEFGLGRADRARGTLAELKELVGRHELHAVPEVANDLERELSRAALGAAPLTADGCLDVLVEALAAPANGVPGNAHIAGSLRTALAAGSVLWIVPDGTAHTPAGEHWDPAALPPGLSAIQERTDADIVHRGDWWLVALSGELGWIALQRAMPLRPAEQQLLRGLARAWILPRTLEQSVDEGALAAEAHRSGAAPLVHGLVGRSDALHDILLMIRRVAATDVSVLILGENGTGKELVAQAIHRASARRSGRFIAVNCASIPGTLLESELFGHERGAFTSAHARRLGRFELAHGGTLMLDEIGEMPLEMQAKILRVLQERSFTRLGGSELVRSDARIIAATNRDLEREIERGRFRMDLFFRLNVVTIHVPPLRERPEDIEPLVRHFLRRHGPEYGAQVTDLSPDALRALVAYSWPGNVRELENALKHALVFAPGGLLRAEDLPSSVLGSGAGPRNRDLETAVRALVDSEDFSEERPLLERLELLLAREMVRRVGNKTVAARMLGVTKPTLYNRLRRYEALYGEEADR